MVVGAPGESSAATGVNGDQADQTQPGSGAAYVYVRTAGTWVQQAYLKASNTEAGDAFGEAVAISGNTIVVGAEGEASGFPGVNGNQADESIPGSGAAYVFERSGSTWTQQAYLKASNPGIYDQFGFSVAISGNTIVVGAPSESSLDTGIDGDQLDDSGGSAGAAYVFVRSGSNWSQQAYVKASNTGEDDGFGFSVAISGDTFVAGALDEESAATGVNGDGSDNTAVASGAAYVYHRFGSRWLLWSL